MRADFPRHSVLEDVTSNSTLNITTHGGCNAWENVSQMPLPNNSSFQSAHISILTAAMDISLLVFRRTLRAMTWSTLEASMTLCIMQHSIASNESPGLIPAVTYIYNTGRRLPSLKVTYVFLTCAFDSSIAVCEHIEALTLLTATLIVGWGYPRPST